MRSRRAAGARPPRCRAAPRARARLARREPPPRRARARRGPLPRRRRPCRARRGRGRRRGRSRRARARRRGGRRASVRALSLPRSKMVRQDRIGSCSPCSSSHSSCEPDGPPRGRRSVSMAYAPSRRSACRNISSVSPAKRLSWLPHKDLAHQGGPPMPESSSDRRARARHPGAPREPALPEHLRRTRSLRVASAAHRLARGARFGPAPWRAPCRAAPISLASPRSTSPRPPRG